MKLFKKICKIGIDWSKEADPFLKLILEVELDRLTELSFKEHSDYAKFGKTNKRLIKSQHRKGRR